EKPGRLRTESGLNEHLGRHKYATGPHYGKFIEPFCGPATKNLNGYIRWLEVRLAGMSPADVVRAS
ncbi:MAG: hypothetical protein ACEPO2_11115, partial [Pelagibaca sp.]